MSGEPLEPRQFVIEFRAGLRISVGQINATDKDAVDRRFNITTLRVGRVPGQNRPGYDRFSAA